MQTIADVLIKKRTKLGLSLTDIEKSTRIRKKYLIAIESSDWKVFPSKTYILGVIKSYGSILDLDQDKLLAFFRREYEQTDTQRFKQKINKKQLVPSSTRIMQVGIVILVLVFAMYFGLQLVNLFTPPKLEIIAPIQDYLPPRTEKFELVGRTEKDAIVEVNGQRYMINENNQFAVKIPVVDKKAKITIKIIGANGKETITTRIFKVL